MAANWVFGKVVQHRKIPADVQRQKAVEPLGGCLVLSFAFQCHAIAYW